MRRALKILAVSVVVIVVALLGVDTGFAINAERSFAKALMSSRDYNGDGPALRYEPEVTISGFPAISSIRNGRYSAIGITARAVDVTGDGTCTRADPCHADLRSRLTDVSVSRPHSWTRPFSPESGLTVGKATASSTVDSVTMGRLLEIDDLTVNTPAPKGKAGGGGPQDGLLSRTTGVLLTGSVSPERGRPKVKVSVSVDLSIVRGDLRLTATDFYSGPEEHSDNGVAPADRVSVLEQFSGTFSTLPMPWGAAPTSARSSGSDIMIEGPAHPEVFAVSAFLNASNIYWMFKVDQPK